jgi:fatty acid desaturase
MNAARRDEFPIPEKLNLILSGLQILGLLALLWTAGQVAWDWKLLCIGLGYALLMNSAYGMLHEAEHGMLHSNRRLNDFVGTILAFFFPAPFHLLRQGHLGHHIRNRSDDEAFDFYFDGENRLWKYWLLYGILTGGFWICIALSNFFIILAPSMIRPKYTSFDRPTEALVESLNPKYQPLIRLESFLILVLHGGLVLFWSIPLPNYLFVLFCFGLIWSAMQYAHHFGTVRDVRKGARNLKTFGWIDRLWLNHNWHLHHHMHPTVPWVYLPRLEAGQDSKRESLIRAYLKQWRGPRYTREHVENHYAGKVIK